tara:strand:+ start:69 stop:812 length:744 start_codon:yes stop_codon:yes gene_type:complete
MTLSKKNIQKYSKQIILKKFGIIGQKKIMNSKVLIVGMGGLGCPLAIYLANLGIGNIGVVDDDKVEISNLNRQIIFNYSDIGKFKVDTAYKKLKKINKSLKVKIFKTRIDKSNIKKIIRNYDIICDGTDNFKTRLLINDFCVEQKKILISAAVSGFNGHLFKFNFKKKTPCFRCYMPEAPDNENNCEDEGVTPPLTGIMGTIQANEVMNTILNVKTDLDNKILILNSLNMNVRKVKLSKNRACANKC